MNIPFYRCVGYFDDGHYLYECLHCGEKIDVGDGNWSPIYCCYCGIEYKGKMLDKKTDYISIPSAEELWFQVEHAYDWEDRKELQWSSNWRGSHNSQKAIEMLNKAREEGKIYNKNLVYRIKMTKKTKHYGSIIINTDKYYKKTGKKFIREQYECQR